MFAAAESHQAARCQRSSALVQNNRIVTPFVSWIESRLFDLGHKRPACSGKDPTLMFPTNEKIHCRMNKSHRDFIVRK